MTRAPKDASSTGKLAGPGVGALMLVYCAAPVLLAVGLAGGLGASLRNPWLIGIGRAVLPAAIVSTATRTARRHRSGHADECCPPPERATDRAAAPAASERRPR
jgi:hypothetical protein